MKTKRIEVYGHIYKEVEKDVYERQLEDNLYHFIEVKKEPYPSVSRMSRLNFDGTYKDEINVLIHSEWLPEIYKETLFYLSQLKEKLL